MAKESQQRQPKGNPQQQGRAPVSREARRPSTAALAWTALIANAVVILQGAVVRSTGSGAGCGSHWPTCNGQVIPLAPTLETGIEFTHRLMSLVVLILGVWLLRRGLAARRERPGLAFFATVSFGFLVIEALIGAATVLLGLTGDNTSVARGVWVAAHLVNSLLLIGALAATVVYARASARTSAAPAFPLQLGRQTSLAVVLGAGIVAMLVLMFTGGIAAMGNTIFPSESLAQGLRADFDPSSHLLIRLRILHPLIAIAVGTYLFVGLGLSWYLKPVPAARRLAQVLLGVYIVQLVIGTANLAFLAPIALQILHLAVAVASFALLSALAVSLLGGHRVAVAETAARGAAWENA